MIKSRINENFFDKIQYHVLSIHHQTISFDEVKNITGLKILCPTQYSPSSDLSHFHDKKSGDKSEDALYFNLRTIMLDQGSARDLDHVPEFFSPRDIPPKMSPGIPDPANLSPSASPRSRIFKFSGCPFCPAGPGF